MKNSFSVVFALLFSITLFAQPGTTKPVAKPAPKPGTKNVTKPVQPVLKNLDDSVGYCVGISVANFYRQMGAKKLNTVLVSRGINDRLGNKQLLIDSITNNSVMNNYLTLLQQPPSKTPVKTVVKPTKALLKNFEDSAFYSVGINVANFYKEMGVKKLNTTLVSRGITDLFGKKKSLVDSASINTVMNNYLTLLQQEKSKGNIKAGEDFLAANKNKPGVMVTASGLQYEILRDSAGIKPVAADDVTVHYRGTFIDGSGFDNSYDRGQPITFNLRGVIPGWTEGLQLMSVGSKYKFYVPYTLGYGAFDYMSIPGGSMLIFEVELLAVKKN
ncbi:MAG TPA: FKBP-type peptidyl-prolyl cis-trans isomerase [Chitinophagaceae bacterium]|nr:FKBP-type peptidyl-prolyl cis-trans isomerase [Chitinophagaceae bacterium]